MKSVAAGAGVFVVAWAVVYLLFIGARRLTGAIARVPGRLPPFGEAPLANARAAGLAARIAITLSGPLTVYLAVVVSTAIGLHATGVIRDDTLVVDVLPGTPAATAGLETGDRIIAAAGAPMISFAHLKETMSSHPHRTLDVEVERAGRRVHLDVTPSAAGRIGVTQRPQAVGVVEALRWSAAWPLRGLADVARWIRDPQGELMGTIAILRAIGSASRRSAGEGLLALGAVVAVSVLDALLVASLLMFPFRRRSPAPAAPTAPGGTEARSAPRPWTRAAARIVDVLIFWLPLAAVSAAVDVVGRGLTVAGLLFLLAWIPFEAALLASWGYTPGKWLLRIKVRDAEGRKLGAREALRRAAAVWMFGLGPWPVTLVTGPLALRRLTRRGRTYWDELDGHVVEHERVGPARAALAIAAVVGVAALTVASYVR